MHCVEGEEIAGGEFKNVPSPGFGIQLKSLKSMTII
jgi:hypothetical protein